MALWTAAARGSKDEVERLLADGGNRGWRQKMTPISQMLLDKAADLTVKPDFGKTRLFFAVMSGHRAIVQCCLDKGADVNVKIGLTPLLMASARGDCAILQMLLDKGADVHAVTAHGAETALHRAAQCGHAGIVRQLLDRSADVRARTAAGKMPEDLASAHGHAAVAAVNPKP